MSKFVLFSTLEFENVALKKDVGLFPIYLKKYFDEVEICYLKCPCNESLPAMIGGVQIKRIGNIRKWYSTGKNYVGKKGYVQDFIVFKKILSYLRKNKDVTHVMLFHFFFSRLIFINNLKRKFPKLKIYIKMDISEDKAASVFILPSRWEGASLALSEAVLNGCYVLGTDVGSIRDYSTDSNWCFIASHSKKDAQDEEIIKNEFVAELQSIIDGKDVLSNMDDRIDFYKKNFLMSTVVNKDFFEEFSK